MFKQLYPRERQRKAHILVYCPNVEAEGPLYRHQIRKQSFIASSQVLNRIGGMALDPARGAALSGRGPVFERVQPARWPAVHGDSPIRLSIPSSRRNYQRPTSVILWDWEVLYERRRPRPTN